MKLKLLAFAAMLTLIGSAPRGETVLWRATPVMESGQVIAMDYHLQFAGDAKGETLLRLPNEWGGERELYTSIRDLNVQGAVVSAGASPDQRVLKHDPGAAITLTYRLQRDGEPSASVRNKIGNDYRPRIDGDVTFILGHAALIQPDHIPASAPSRFVVSDVAGAPRFVSDLEAAANKTVPFKDLSESVLIGGDIRLIQAGGRQRLAIHGVFENLNDADFTRAFKQVSKAQRAYWKVGSSPYLVTVLVESGPEGSFSLGGTGLDDAFALFSTPDMAMDDVLPIVAHEMMHTWIPGAIGAMPDENKATDYWLSEGFTEWATLRSLIQSGAWTIEQYADAFNKSLAAYDLSSYRMASAGEIAVGFWSTPELSKVPYQRGLLIAARLDADIRDATTAKDDLDDVLHAMKRAAEREPDTLASVQLAKAINKVAGLDRQDFLTRSAIKGEPFELPESLFAPCGRIVAKTRALWERGFDFSATAANDWSIQGVTPDSNAYAAGLRNGMKLAQWSEDSNDRDASKPVTALVHEGSSVRSISWVPAAKETRRVRQLELATGMTKPERRACARRLAGR